MFVCLAAGSCDLSDASLRNMESLPLSVGNRWVYQNVTADSSIVRIDTLKVISSRMINGSIFYKVTPPLFGNFFWEIQEFSNQGMLLMGVIQDGEDAVPIGGGIIPPVTIDTIAFNPNASIGEHTLEGMRVKMVHPEIMVRTATDIFTTSQYDVYQDSVLIAQAWFAVNIGLVKYKERQNKTRTLISYSLK